MFHFFLLSIIIAFVFSCASAQDNSESNCPKQINYINRNQIDLPRITVRGVEGRATDSNAVPIPDVCVALFTEKEHRFVAQTMTDENGYFRFTKIPKGDYRLVARMEIEYLCPVNVSIRLASFPSGGLFRRKRIYLHFVVPGTDSCSYADTKKVARRK
jgi:hypothetical protein